MSRVRSIGRLSLTPPLTPADVRRVAGAAARPGLWAPCPEGCCLCCVGAASGEQLKEALRELLRSALTLAGVRSVHGSVGVVVDGRVVTLNVSHNRITHRAGSPGGAVPHRPVTWGASTEGGEDGGEVISLASWR